MPAASEITIVELDGLQRSLTLQGGGLPKQGATWGAEQRLKTRFPAGNPEAVQHVMGPALAPSDWEGTWRTNILTRTPATYVDESGNGQTVSVASTLAAALEAIAVGGALLEVTWAADDGRQILRRGRLGPVSFAYDRFDDVHWKAKFEWTSRGSSPTAVSLFGDEAAEAQSVSAALQSLDDVATEIAEDAAQSFDPDNWGSASYATLGDLEGFSASFTLSGLVSGSIDASFSVGFGFGATSSFSSSANVGFGAGVSASSPLGGGGGYLSGLVASVQAAFADVQGALAAARSAKLSAREQAREAASSARRIVADLGGAQNLLGQVPPELLSSVATPSAVLRATRTAAKVSGRVDDAMTTALALRKASRQVLASTRLGHDRVDRGAVGDATQVVVAKAGETFASLSKRFYGSPEHGSVIAKANGFAAYRIAPGAGARVSIPPLRSSARS